MVPPGDVFGIIPIWLAVYVLSIGTFATAAYILYLRVFRFVLLGKDPDRFDQPVRRFFGALPFIFGQRKVLQSVSLRDRAGLAHFFIFWGFLSFTASYILYIFADSIWPQFSETILTDTGVRIFTAYLDILAVIFFVILIWAAVRRWGIKPRRLSFDLTQKAESAIILLLIACLMLFTLLTEAFYVASGGHGPHADALIGRPLGDAFANAGIDGHLANALQGVFWWLHLAIILGFSLYIPLSKHMHIVAAPNQLLHPQARRARYAHHPRPRSRPRQRGSAGREQDTGLHLEGTPRRLLMRRLRTLLRQLPRQHHRQDTLTHAHS